MSTELVDRMYEAIGVYKFLFDLVLEVVYACGERCTWVEMMKI